MKEGRFKKKKKKKAILLLDDLDLHQRAVPHQPEDPGHQHLLPVRSHDRHLGTLRRKPVKDLAAPAPGVAWRPGKHHWQPGMAFARNQG